MCEVEFFGRCVLEGMYERLFYVLRQCALLHYQMVDLEGYSFD